MKYFKLEKLPYLTQRRILKFLVFIFTVGAIIFSMFTFTSCVFDNDSNNITKDGIHYSKTTVRKDGISTEGYDVVGCDSNITALTIPDKINNLPVIHIKQWAFLNNENLIEVKLPNTITYIALGYSPFKGCTNIEKVTTAVSNIISLFTDSSSLLNTNDAVPSSLKYVYLTEGCTKINDSDFKNCSNIQELHIPTTVTEIKVGLNGNTASNNKFSHLPFAGCSNLKIYCAANSKPDGWSSYWNYIDEQNQAQVFWNSY